MSMQCLAPLLVFAFALVFHPSAPSAQQTGKVFRVGFLNLGSASSAQPRFGVFLEALRNLGYEEGRNLIVEARFADGAYDQLPVLARELARLKVDVFLTPGEPVLLAAKEKGENIPIVVISCDPLEKPLGSLRRPGGNATGFTCVSSDLVSKRLSLFTSLLPVWSALRFSTTGGTITNWSSRTPTRPPNRWDFVLCTFPLNQKWILNLHSSE